MTTLQYVLCAVAALVVGLLVAAARKPGTFRVMRSIRIGAPAAKVFPLLVDFRAWAKWSPWEGLDPAMRRTHEGAASGVGAIYAWEGNKKVGKGRMEILSAKPAESVVIKLDFLAPFEAHNTATFALKPDGAGCETTWTMEGPQPFMMKVMCLFMNMDAMVGKDFEKGLAALKAVAEA